jgi:chromosome partitioning protein
MKKIAFLAQKGGSGKTTLAVHTAVAASEAGESVVVIDTDPQKSATVWGDARTQDVPIVATAAAAELGRVLEVAYQEGMTLVVVDTAPHAAPDATRIVRAVDLIAIPVRPTAFDIAAAGSAVDIAKAAGVPAVFVLSACPFRSPEIAETRTVLADYGLPIAPVEIIDRRAFARAVATGRAVTEFESDGKAANEIRQLWAWLKEKMQ